MSTPTALRGLADRMSDLDWSASKAHDSLMGFAAAWRAGSLVYQLRDGSPCCGASNRHCELLPRQVIDTPTGCGECGHTVSCHWF